MWNIVAGSNCRNLTEDVTDLIKMYDRELPDKYGTAIIQSLFDFEDLNEIIRWIDYYKKAYKQIILILPVFHGPDSYLEILNSLSVNRIYFTDVTKLSNKVLTNNKFNVISISENVFDTIINL